MEAQGKPFLSSSCSNVIRPLPQHFPRPLPLPTPRPADGKRALAGVMLAVHYCGNVHPAFWWLSVCAKDAIRDL